MNGLDGAIEDHIRLRVVDPVNDAKRTLRQELIEAVQANRGGLLAAAVMAYKAPGISKYAPTLQFCQVSFT